MVTHADKLINNIITCIKVVHNLGNDRNENVIHNLNQLLEATKQIVERNRNKATKEATKLFSTNSDKSVKHNGDKATEDATEPPAQTRTSPL